MRIAFYAPMKPPTSEVPSGDRQMARALMAALRSKGHRVDLAARLASREPIGSPTRQARFAELGDKLAQRYIRRNRPDIWFTYHLYYKAPDWIGPRVTAALGIPYVVAEASFAPKRAGGPWDISHRAVEAAIRRADLVFGLNPTNEPCVRQLARSFVRLKPFLESTVFTRQGTSDLLTVAMMRPGDKLASYRLLADILRRLPGVSLTIVGSGPAETEVRAAFAGLPATFTTEVGYGGEVFVWPAINEAYGMAILEAQAAGLPVVAGYSPGVAEIVRDGETGILVAQNNAESFARAVGKLLADPILRKKMGEAARARVAAEHSFEAAAELIDRHIRALVP